MGNETVAMGEAAMRAVTGLEQIAAKLGAMAPDVWNALLYMKTFDSITGLVALVLTVLVTIFLTRFLVQRQDEIMDNFGLFVLVFVAAIMAVLAFTLILFTPSFILGFMKPDVCVIQDIIKAATTR